MDTALLARPFEKMGARIKPSSLPSWENGFSMNILRDKEGEFFAFQARGNMNLAAQVVDLRPEDRHLLLLVKESAQDGKVTKHRFLCGHDERHWFVAAVPGRSVKNVREAMEALKPESVRDRELQVGVKGHGRRRRKNAAYIRQGEWFFTPEPGLNPPKHLVLRNEPIRRGDRGKPHMIEFVYRSGGENVYVNTTFPNGITEDQYRALVRRNPKNRDAHWRTMRRGAAVYAKGRVWHEDHSTIVLPGWHRVQMNREAEAPSMRNVAFLD